MSSNDSGRSISNHVYFVERERTRSPPYAVDAKVWKNERGDIMVSLAQDSSVGVARGFLREEIIRVAHPSRVADYRTYLDPELENLQEDEQDGEMLSCAPSDSSVSKRHRTSAWKPVTQNVASSSRGTSSSIKGGARGTNILSHIIQPANRGHSSSRGRKEGMGDGISREVKTQEEFPPATLLPLPQSPQYPPPRYTRRAQPTDPRYKYQNEVHFSHGRRIPQIDPRLDETHSHLRAADATHSNLHSELQTMSHFDEIHHSRNAAHHSRNAATVLRPVHYSNDLKDQIPFGHHTNVHGQGYSMHYDRQKNLNFSPPGVYSSLAHQQNSARGGSNSTHEAVSSKRRTRLPELEGQPEGNIPEAVDSPLNYSKLSMAAQDSSTSYQYPSEYSISNRDGAYRDRRDRSQEYLQAHSSSRFAEGFAGFSTGASKPSKRETNSRNFATPPHSNPRAINLCDIEENQVSSQQKKREANVRDQNDLPSSATQSSSQIASLKQSTNQQDPSKKALSTQTESKRISSQTQSHQTPDAGASLEESRAVQQDCSQENKSENSSGPTPEDSTSSSQRNDLKCGVCNKVFRSRYGIVRHLRTHTGERPFECDICGKRFRQNVHLVTHRRARHERNLAYMLLQRMIFAQAHTANTKDKDKK